jgi:hypothetical protein
MELGQFKDSDTQQPELKLDELGKAYLLETARWAKFLAVLGISFMALYLLGGLVLAAAITSNPEFGVLTKGLGVSGVLLLYSLVIFIGVYPLYALLRYSILIKRAINNTDMALLNNALRFHRNYYRYNGIIVLVMIGLYALVFVMMILIGGMAAVAS